MITNKQKMYFSVLSIVAVVLSILAILPFSVFFNRLEIKIENLESIELIVKMIILPLIAFGISLYSMKIRSDNYYTQIDVSDASIKMSYIPLAMYISGLMGWIGECIYTSVSYTEDIMPLIALMGIWGGSIFILMLFGVFTGWLNRLSSKKFISINVIVNIFSLLMIIGSFLIYKKIPNVDLVRENNAFLTILLYSCLYFVALLILWKAIYSDQCSPVVLAKDEKFTEEEEAIFIISAIEEEVRAKFDEYYDINRGKYIDVELEKEVLENAPELKNKEEVQDEK